MQCSVQQKCQECINAACDGKKLAQDLNNLAAQVSAPVRALSVSLLRANNLEWLGKFKEVLLADAQLASKQVVQLCACLYMGALGSERGAVAAD